jgi:hypothetical protein
MMRLRRAALLLVALSSVAGVAASCSDTNRSTLPTPPSTTDEPACSVSDILEPSCGAWLGASTPSKDGTFDYAVGLAEYEAVAGNEPDIQHFYKRDGEPFPTADEIALSERPGKQRSLLFYNWKPSTDLTWRQVADGQADDNIATVAASMSEYAHHMFLAIYHEPENDEQGPGSGMTSVDYVDMYRYVVGQLRDLGVDNAVYVMNYLGFSTWATAVDRFYPGDDVVDWIGYDPYGLAKHTSFIRLLNDPVEADDWPGFYDWATAKAPGKPIMVAEWGFDLPEQPAAADALESAPPVLQYQFPMIKALVYWNDFSEGGFEVRIDQPGPEGDAYGQAYATFANSDYFNQTPTAAAP